MKVIDDAYNKSKGKNIYEIVSATYAEHELDDIVANEYSVEVLNQKYPIECVRKSKDTYETLLNQNFTEEYIANPDEDDFPWIIYLGENHYVFLLYNDVGKCIYSSKNSISNTELSSFLNIKKGDTLDKIKELDANGDYTYIENFTGVVMPPTSQHYTKDGYIVGIIYDDNYCVDNVYWVNI